MRGIFAEKIKHGSFQAAKTEIVAGLVKHAAGKGDGARITGLGEPVNFRAAGITKLEELGNFIEGFAGCIVHGLAKNDVLADAAHMRENCMTTGDNQRNHWQAGPVECR